MLQEKVARRYSMQVTLQISPPISFFSLTYIFPLIILLFKLQGCEESKKGEKSKKQNFFPLE